MFSLLLILALGYLIGSISPSILIGKLFFGVDVRQVGSGNAGMTNAIRAFGKKVGTMVALIDLFKGFVASFWIGLIRTDLASWQLESSALQIGAFTLDPVLVQIFAGAAVVAGHIFPLFFGFRGGKGVLTIAGVVLGISPVPVLICMLLFGVVFGLTRYVSLGSILAAVAFPIIVLLQKVWLGDDVSYYLIGFSIVAAVLIVVTHLANIKRLLLGEENRFGSKKTAE